MKKFFKGIGNFFKKIGLFIWKYVKVCWNYIKENAWIQPIAIVAFIELNSTLIIFSPTIFE